VIEEPLSKHQRDLISEHLNEMKSESKVVGASVLERLLKVIEHAPSCTENGKVNSVKLAKCFVLTFSFFCFLNNSFQTAEFFHYNAKRLISFYNSILNQHGQPSTSLVKYMEFLQAEHGTKLPLKLDHIDCAAFRSLSVHAKTVFFHWLASQIPQGLNIDQTLLKKSLVTKSKCFFFHQTRFLIFSPFSDLCKEVYTNLGMIDTFYAKIRSWSDVSPDRWQLLIEFLYDFSRYAQVTTAIIKFQGAFVSLCQHFLLQPEMKLNELGDLFQKFLISGHFPPGEAPSFTAEDTIPGSQSIFVEDNIESPKPLTQIPSDSQNLKGKTSSQSGTPTGQGPTPTVPGPTPQGGSPNFAILPPPKTSTPTASQSSSAASSEQTSKKTNKKGGGPIKLSEVTLTEAVEVAPSKSEIEYVEARKRRSSTAVGRPAVPQVTQTQDHPSVDSVFRISKFNAFYLF